MCFTYLLVREFQPGTTSSLVRRRGQFAARLRSRFAYRQLRLQVKRPDMKSGQWCWRVTIRFEDGDAYDVDLIDYH